ncbi:MAG TPA: alpha/beta hydrolase [Gemmatimonadales bacterium]|nr:alpha/beta hydrolase [Gemmatimonadales bacterium]
MLLFALALTAWPGSAGVPDSIPPLVPVVRDIQVGPDEVLRTTSMGAGEPLVLIPGIFGAAYGYRMLTGPLARLGYRTIVVEPLGYGWSSHPKDADYSFGAQTGRVSRALDSLGVSGALIVAQSSGAAIAFRLAVQRPDLVRGLLSIDGGPAESAATPGMKKAFKFGGGLVKFALDESKLRHDVRQEIVRNSGDTTWITDAVVRGYTAGQTADLGGSIDAFQRMSKAKEPTSLADQLHRCTMPVHLLLGTVRHPSEVSEEQREMLGATLRNFRVDSVKGSGQYIQEERPGAVLEAVAQLDAAASRATGSAAPAAAAPAAAAPAAGPPAAGPPAAGPPAAGPPAAGPPAAGPPDRASADTASTASR